MDNCTKANKKERGDVKQSRQDLQRDKLELNSRQRDVEQIWRGEEGTRVGQSRTQQQSNKIRTGLKRERADAIETSESILGGIRGCGDVLRSDLCSSLLRGPSS